MVANKEKNVIRHILIPHFLPHFTLSGHNVWVLYRAHGKQLNGWNDRYCMANFGDAGSIRLMDRKK
ncbi:hypothetical protein JW926_05205 [Candidatus Sumerlaeota bacterium]|nr:hypothetical protein [Candidatus Sumerlaeota bacterium]